MTSVLEIKRNRIDLEHYLPASLQSVSNLQTEIPRLAKDQRIMRDIEFAAAQTPTTHHLFLADARSLAFIPDNSVHLIVTSPPYWNLKKYNPHEHQLGDIDDYDKFLNELDKVWRHSFRVLTPGGRLVCVVGDVLLSRKRNKGRHTVVPFHASIQERCRQIGFDNLAPIIWHKISNVAFEATGNGAGFLGKPYEPNAIIKNDIEYILMQRKPGGYRKVSSAARLLSIISAENHKRWFNQVWTGVTGASTRHHPAPYPEELAERLIRMFSFVGDTVLDPFMGTGTTNIVASKWGRNSIGVEIDPIYFEYAHARLQQLATSFFTHTDIVTMELDIEVQR